MKSGKIFIISGPSGSGKTTLCEKVLQETNIKKRIIKMVSVTTRQKRAGEKLGRDYFFVSKKMFLYKKRRGHFLESKKVFDNYYGTPKRVVKETLSRGKDVLLCIDVKGAKDVVKIFPAAITIFVRTPSFADLKNRLAGRGSENKKTTDLRLKTAKSEMKEEKKYKYIVINDNLSKAIKELEEIMLDEIIV
ncbi:MAG: guanylate kinase [Omnitrophica WOR_2 bacterium GWF2_38_59]|nr:MAG: guanylate kinase [Omnitrophica WOR_2 bacterium GWF2_38_59]OGX49942.1 MAG: guanylate kinase [Omnitrophica WOR_2 bacterium RIFOXYA2_FULL_38_17]OGX53694.1 MAG: guanylate kinase [Omnitrophica WOR_2 bacterium RIFOXYA12_FULL_38_10]OGX56545.1 MAG: guanylate kinase [Omnitrophica WOR_2 bacterium RIFOXYB2_FULL_38_16]OGX58123.1 MAG: guanylate kinase [Omnitrophica WOR_2 bacterium RIFOXYC2_FULL_38_12]HBG61173.1 guanylate kinase [Candidatus Omnitrophota bacterium]